MASHTLIAFDRPLIGVSTPGHAGRVYSEAEVAAMPAGGHAILGEARQAVERRAGALLAQLQEVGDEAGGAAGEAVDHER